MFRMSSASASAPDDSASTLSLPYFPRIDFGFFFFFCLGSIASALRCWQVAQVQVFGCLPVAQLCRSLIAQFPLYP